MSFAHPYNVLPPPVSDNPSVPFTGRLRKIIFLPATPTPFDDTHPVTPGIYPQRVPRSGTLAYGTSLNLFHA